jgi:hypothetical protein
MSLYFAECIICTMSVLILCMLSLLVIHNLKFLALSKYFLIADVQTYSIHSYMYAIAFGRSHSVYFLVVIVYE